jgi:hypothetical protein
LGLDGTGPTVYSVPPSSRARSAGGERAPLTSAQEATHAQPIARKQSTCLVRGVAV